MSRKNLRPKEMPRMTDNYKRGFAKGVEAYDQMNLETPPLERSVYSDAAAVIRKAEAATEYKNRKPVFPKDDYVADGEEPRFENPRSPKLFFISTQVHNGIMHWVKEVKGNTLVETTDPRKAKEFDLTTVMAFQIQFDNTIMFPKDYVLKNARVIVVTAELDYEEGTML